MGEEKGELGGRRRVRGEEVGFGRRGGKEERSDRSATIVENTKSGASSFSCLPPFSAGQYPPPQLARTSTKKGVDLVWWVELR